MNAHKPNYYAIIPANVRYDEKLSPNEKLFYGEITALTTSYTNDFEKEFLKISENIKEELENKFAAYKLYYEPYQDLTDIVLEVKPEYSVQTKDVVETAEIIFNRLLEYLNPYIKDSNNMAYYIKYLLDRWLPEEFVVRGN